VKQKHIEIQLGGGGYGTLGDSLKTIVVRPPVPKTEREKIVEQDLKKAKDQEARRELESKLDRLRNDRRREERLLGILAQGQQAAKRSQAEQTALDTGSRFNIRFQRDITPSDISPDLIRQSLAQFLEFEP